MWLGVGQRSALVIIGGLLVLMGCRDLEADEAILANVDKGDAHLLFTLQGGTVTGKTRMSDDIVQGQDEPVFRGIQDITLFVYAKDKDDNVSWTPYKLEVEKAYPGPDSPTQFYHNIILPDNASRFLFYSEAVPSGTDPCVNGVLVPTGLASEDINDICFGLQPILEGKDDENKAEGLADYLTRIAEIIRNQDNTLFQKIITNNAGSSASVLALITHFYQDNPSEYLKNAIESGGLATISGNTITFDASLKGYPANIGLPDGAATMKWIYDSSNGGDDKFVSNKIDASNVGSEGHFFSGTPLNSFTYPPSLYYFVDSPASTSERKECDDYAEWLYARQQGYFVDGQPDSDTSWEHYLEMNDFVRNTQVHGGIRWAAVADRVQYAVSRLDLTVRATSSVIKDAKGRQVFFTASAFPITGILIGNQNSVDYRFDPKMSGASVVYDTQLPANIALSTSESPVCKTLLLESQHLNSNYENASDENKAVYRQECAVNVAVEFLNNSGFPFYGFSTDDKERIIPNGTKFYLIGQLQLDEDQIADNHHCVLLKDHVTHVSFVVNDFQNAYNVVPDMRNPKLVIGLTANIFWQRGILVQTTEIN